MATTLIAILIVLLGTHAIPDLARARRFAWLKDAFGGGDGKPGDELSRTLLVGALILILTALLQSVLHRHWFGLLELAFMVVTLFLSWGPRDLDSDLDAIAKAPDSEQRRAAAQALHDGISAQAVTFTAAGLVESSFAAALSRQFGVLFWFAVLGPVGAVGYRLVQLLARSGAFAECVGASQPRFERAALVLDWAPAHLLAFSVALVSDFDATLRAWRDYHANQGRRYFTLDLGFLAVIARAGVDADVIAEDGDDGRVGDPLAELADSRLLLRRVLFGWIALIAIVVLGGWVG